MNIRFDLGNWNPDDSFYVIGKENTSFAGFGGILVCEESPEGWDSAVFCLLIQTYEYNSKEVDQLFIAKERLLQFFERLDVFKVQRSIFSSDGSKRLLLYNDDRSIVCEVVNCPELEEFMGDEFVKYARVHFDFDGNVTVFEKVSPEELEGLEFKE